MSGVFLAFTSMACLYIERAIGVMPHSQIRNPRQLVGDAARGNSASAD